MKKTLILVLLITPLISVSNENENHDSSATQIETPEQGREKLLSEFKDRYEKVIKDNPPLPPWLKFPTYERYDLGWRMGDGESYMYSDIDPYFHFATEYEKVQYQLKYPTPSGWEGWYEK